MIGIVVILLVMRPAAGWLACHPHHRKVAFLLYTLFGSYIPGSFGHRGYTLKQLSTHMSLPWRVCSDAAWRFLHIHIPVYTLWRVLEKTALAAVYRSANAIAESGPAAPQR